jgi:hypothetical protein
MSLLWKRQNIGVKTESVEGTAIAMTATDFLLAEDLQFKPDIEMVERNFRRPTLDTLSALAGKRKGEVTFRTPVKGSGSAGTPDVPRGAIYLASGFSETSSTYAPISAKPTGFSSPAKTCTVCFQLDGFQARLSGCIGNVKWVLKAGQIPMMEVTLKGVYEVPTDVALTAATPSTIADLIVQSSSFTYDSVAMVIDTLEIDCGNEIVERPSTISTGGLAGFLLTGRKPVGTIDPELLLVASYNFLAKQVTGTPASLSIVCGSAAGNIATFTLAKTQITGVDFGERNGVAVANCKLSFNQNTGDDWLSLVFT